MTFVNNSQNPLSLVYYYYLKLTYKGKQITLTLSRHMSYTCRYLQTDTHLLLGNPLLHRFTAVPCQVQGDGMRLHPDTAEELDLHAGELVWCWPLDSSCRFDPIKTRSIDVGTGATVAWPVRYSCLPYHGSYAKSWRPLLP